MHTVKVAPQRTGISALIASLHGVDGAEDDEIYSGDGITGGFLSSWYHETDMSQKMVIEAKRKEMEKFKRMRVHHVGTREPWNVMKRER